ncbi:hypothetical protein NDU88_005181 [Pleurodeles waltl]|uniref:Uncharacterized protein n=1 Tax=Pleurodeles waltl TaxID=8319 RepID=A0AAV7VMT1_PLEWA|nr:hypothetical protein NDU88_005181 [Pleurodeles waltl]
MRLLSGPGRSPWCKEVEAEPRKAARASLLLSLRLGPCSDQGNDLNLLMDQGNADRGRGGLVDVIASPLLSRANKTEIREFTLPDIDIDTDEVPGSTIVPPSIPAMPVVAQSNP